VKLSAAVTVNDISRLLGERDEAMRLVLAEKRDVEDQREWLREQLRQIYNCLGTGSNMTIGQVLSDIEDLRRDAVRFKADYEQACAQIAAMHEAAVGEVRGPIRGVVEDVQDLRVARDALAATAKEQHALLEEARQERRNAFAIANSLRKDCLELGAKLDAAEAERDDYREGHARALKDREAVEVEMDERVTTLVAEREAALAQVESLTADRKRLSAEVDSLVIQRDRARDDIRTAIEQRRLSDDDAAGWQVLANSRDKALDAIYAAMGVARSVTPEAVVEMIDLMFKLQADAQGKLAAIRAALDPVAENPIADWEKQLLDNVDKVQLGGEVTTCEGGC
jgi:chromosome segregation ATPase